jgi:hypothetical protein
MHLGARKTGATVQEAKTVLLRLGNKGAEAEMAELA